MNVANWLDFACEQIYSPLNQQREETSQLYSMSASKTLQPAGHDDRDPLTCHGVKKDGTPCRNRRAASPSPGESTSTNGGADTPYYCHHHRDQAPQKNGIHANDSSVDSLGLQFGRLAVNDGKEKPTAGRPSTKPAKKNSSCLSLLCCLLLPDEPEPLPPSRPKPTVQRPPQKATPPRRPEGSSAPEKKRPAGSSAASPSPHGQAGSTGKQSNQPSTSSRPSPFSSSQPSRLVRVPLIPPQSSLQTGIDISEKLAGAVNAKDEDGFIYILWELPLSKASERGLLRDVAINLPPPTSDRQRDIRRSLGLSDGQTNTNHKPAKLRLKIGCTLNVPERLDSLRRQCGLNLAVARSYPHVTHLQQPSSSASPSSSPRRSPARSNGASQALASGRKVRHFRVVERLIHLELDELRVRDEVCGGCGKLHREWFEVEATLDSLRRVDECIRKWVAWADTADEAKPTCFGDLAGKTVLINRFGLLEYADWIPSDACRELVQQTRSRN